MNRASAEVSLSAIADNLKLIKSKTDSQVLAVVKADAYGHGLIPGLHHWVRILKLRLI